MADENLEEGHKEKPKHELEHMSGKALEGFSIADLPLTKTPSAEPSKSSQVSHLAQSFLVDYAVD